MPDQPTVRKSWPPIIARAAELVDESPSGVTMRQVFYLLVSEGLIRNAESDYKKLSALTAKGRREGTFPALIDMTRTIGRLRTYASLRDALEDVTEDYRRDPLEGQNVVPVIVVEKATLVTQMWRTFGRRLGVPVTALRGYASETLETQILDLVDDADHARKRVTEDPDAGHVRSLSPFFFSICPCARASGKRSLRVSHRLDLDR